jgi:hypothetical protein
MRSLFFFVCLPTLLFAQETKKADPLVRFSVLAGEWQGTGEGKPGVSAMEREYAFILNGKFLQVKNKSVYATQPNNPKGETHEDIGLISYDMRRKVYVFRQFHGEGFVNQYVLDTLLSDNKKFVFVTESIENIPPGWRAKEIYIMLSANEFEEIFELAEPGKDFEVYSKSRHTRKQ